MKNKGRETGRREKKTKRGGMGQRNGEKELTYTHNTCSYRGGEEEGERGGGEENRADYYHQYNESSCLGPAILEGWSGSLEDDYKHVRTGRYWCIPDPLAPSNGLQECPGVAGASAFKVEPLGRDWIVESKC